MDRVFVSSLARGGMSEVRAAVKRAVESLGMVPVMFETTGATDRPSRSALTEKVEGADVTVLILGAEYGEPGESGHSPTEDEFNAARTAGVPVLPIVQEGVDREPEQEAFVSRVRGTWETGTFAPSFTTAEEAGFAAVRALAQWKNDKPAGERKQALSDRARSLAAGITTASRT
ncbi:DUF4062 domain-containing protein [Patulibacter sp. SYSU D01012]|uniref:DUF4062 domain-containing protein n=1 Tax=Patulibacter sp. SYSU D01012 TaxID=2817381 RepID=UPI001B30D1A6|nr:DUF4062 domain-containing protein [Patulibacter sp. SYSU D01012]